MNPLARTLEALLFLSPEPAPPTGRGRQIRLRRLTAALEELPPTTRRVSAGWSCASSRAAGRWHGAGAGGGRAPPAGPAAHPAADAGTVRDARDRRLPAARVAAGDHPHPRRRRRFGVRHAAGARPDRGVGALAVRCCPLSDPAFLKLSAYPLGNLPEPAAWDPTPDEESDLRERLLSAGDVRAGRQPGGRGRRLSDDADALRRPGRADARRRRRALGHLARLRRS